tara:strand:- start:98 stop:268 length:171 start_codon:yes stop_codon:yes gene_type:complete
MLFLLQARVAELVDAADLKSVASNGVRVQVPPWALFCNQWQKSAKTRNLRRLVAVD